MKEHTGRRHKLLYGFNSEMFWKVSLRGEEIGGGEAYEEKVGGVTVEMKIEKKYGPKRNFIQVLNKEADEIKTYPIKEGSHLYNKYNIPLTTQLMRIDDNNTLLCYEFHGIYYFHHLEND